MSFSSPITPFGGRTLRSAVRAFTTVAVCVGALSMVSSPASASATSAEPTSAFRPVAPCRLMDTREGGQVKPGNAATLNLAVRERCGIAADATAVAVTVTVTQATGPGFITVWPSGQAMPVASTSNFSTGETRANSALLSLGTNGALSLFVQTSTHVIVDVSGEFYPARSSSTGRYVPVVPFRALDTRDGGGAALGRNSTVTIQPASIPADATAMAVMLTVTQATAATFVTAFPAGGTVPNASSLNTDAAYQTRTATQVVPVSDTGLSAFSFAGGHIIIDVVGYFTGSAAAETSEGLFVPATPTRILDTRHSGQIFAAGTVLAATSAVTGPNVSSVAANVTVTQSGPAGYVTAFAARTVQPGTPAVTYNHRDETVANLGLVSVSAAGVAVASTSGTHAIIDITGWFTGSPVPMTTDVPGNNGPTRTEPTGPIGCLQYVPAPSNDGVYSIKPGQMQAVTHIFANGPLGPIVVVGDSLTWGSADQTARALRAKGWGPICIDGTISRTVEHGSGSIPDGLDAVARIKGSNPIWSGADVTWVVSLGTNDVGFSNGNSNRSDQYVNHMVSAIGANAVWWMNIHTARRGWQGQEASFNESIARSGVGVIDWYSRAAGNGLTAGDQVHLTTNGYQVRADLLADSVQAR